MTRLALNAPSEAHLCKSILFVNTRYQQGPAQSIWDPINAQYYLVIVQYVDKINTQKLNNYVHSTLGGSQVSKKKYNMRLAPEEKAEELTGFIRNGVCPLGTRFVLLMKRYEGKDSNHYHAKCGKFTGT